MNKKEKEIISLFEEKNNLKIRLKLFPSLTNPIAVVGSPGLRSVGKLALNSLVKKLKAKLFLQIYSKSFPVFYETKPSYAPMPGFLGDAGVKFKNSKFILPKVNFYFAVKPEIILVRGYHANFQGQYEVAWGVLDLLEKFNVKKMIVLAGYGMDGPEVCCAATKKELLDEAKKNFGLDVGYEGPFMGFSGLIFGLAILKNIDALCLFGKTQPYPENPEKPDPEAAEKVYLKLCQMLGLNSNL